MNTLKKKVAAFNAMLADVETTLHASEERVDTLKTDLKKAIDEGDSKKAIALQRDLSTAEADKAAAGEVYRSVSERSALTTEEVRSRFAIRRAEMERELSPYVVKMQKQIDAIKGTYKEYMALYDKLDDEADTWQEFAEYTQEAKNGRPCFNFRVPRADLSFAIRDFLAQMG